MPAGPRGAKVALTLVCALPESIFVFTRQTRFNTVLLICSLISIGLTQTNRATIKLSGTVFDPNKAVIPGTSLTLKNLADQTLVHTNTNEAGIFVFEALKSDRYELSVESLGFEKHVESISVETGNDKELKVELRWHQCPDPVKRLSEKEKSETHFCRVHQKKLKLDIVRIEYGLVVVASDDKEFPNSRSVYYGGCVADCYEKAEVLFCPTCREIESKIEGIKQ